MKRYFYLFLTQAALLFSLPQLGAVDAIQSKDKKLEISNFKDEIVFFAPPPNWQIVSDPSLLPKSVRTMVVGKGKYPLPPSMNLATQPYKGTLKQYLKSVKAINDSQGSTWKDLGFMKTDSGNANLSQVDRKTQWGDERLMHVILFKNETIYILTASALKDEFSEFYKEFFASMRSLKVLQNIFEIVIASPKRTQLIRAVTELEKQWQLVLDQRNGQSSDLTPEKIKEDIFKGEPFKTTNWIPFTEMLKQNFKEITPEWQSYIMQKIESDLLAKKPNKQSSIQ